MKFINKLHLTKMILLLHLIYFAHSNAQVDNQSDTKSNFNVADSSIKIEMDSVNTQDEKVTIAALPFALYSEIFGWAAGGFVGIQGISQRNTSLYMGGLISTNGTKYGFIQLREFYLPFYPRLYIAPDILGGYFGVLKVYKDNPVSLSDSNKQRAGSNDSNKDDYIEVSGSDQWYEIKFRFLLPIGHGKDNVYFSPKLENGILISGEMGGTNWNPFISGRTFIDIKPFYRKRISFTTNGIDFSLTRENTDFYVNPTQGSFQRLSFRRDFGWFDSSSPWSVIETDIRWYLPIHKYFDEKSLPKVLAIDFWTVNTLTWNNYDVKDVDLLGNEIKSYHRPPPYTGAYLGGRYHLRAFYEGRFNDRAAIYYGIEYRQVIKWNPFDYWSFTRKLNVHWLQFAFFAELGRVAPEWDISTLHTDMKWDFGAGMRMFMNNLILRLDYAYSTEDSFIQMYVDHAF